MKSSRDYLCNPYGPLQFDAYGNPKMPAVVLSVSRGGLRLPATRRARVRRAHRFNRHAPSFVFCDDDAAAVDPGTEAAGNLTRISTSTSRMAGRLSMAA